jgi:F420-dependent oxidoreductase-like protein
MDVGLMIPQGWKGEYDGWRPADAWARTVELARDAEACGFGSEWVFDHFHTVPEPTDEITFESFTTLTGMAMVTERVRLGHMVICTGFRNPALTAKLSSTLDVVSGGRFELGIGAGWKEDEWRAYGYGFPTLAERVDALGEHLEVITRMLGPGRATFEGDQVRVRGAINVPKGIQEHIPIIVGGNGRNRVMRYAVRYADELNYVFLTPEEIAERRPEIEQACAETGRNPATLKLSVYLRDEDVREPGQARVDLLASYAGAGLSRIVAFPTRWNPTAEAQGAFAEDCASAGLVLRAAEASTAGG